MMDAQTEHDDYVILGDIDVFQSKDGKVISIEDQEYLKPCGEPVMTQVGVDGQDATFCVKIVDHPSGYHEDKHGRTRPDFRTPPRWPPYRKAHVIEDDIGVYARNDATPAYNFYYPPSDDEGNFFKGLLVGIIIMSVLTFLAILIARAL